MPISFWKDHSGRGDLPVAPDDCRERYIADGRRVAGRLARSESVLAVWLSGPFTLPRIAPESDLHMAVLTEAGGGHLYHHRLPHFSEVGRRLEIAFFPIDYFEMVIERGYAAWGDIFDGHKLDDVEILFEREGVLSGLLDRIGEVRPARMFVGMQIEALKREFAVVERFLDAAGRVGAAGGPAGDGGGGRDGFAAGGRETSLWGEVILRARTLTTSALKLLIIAGRGRLFSKPSHLHPALRSLATDAAVADYELVHDIDGLREGEGVRIVGMCGDLIRELYERQGVCAADSD